MNGDWNDVAARLGVYEDATVQKTSKNASNILAWLYTNAPAPVALQNRCSRDGRVRERIEPDEKQACVVLINTFSCASLVVYSASSSRLAKRRAAFTRRSRRASCPGA